jgi:hypothetical protein
MHGTNEMNNKKPCGCFRRRAGLVYNGKIHILLSRELTPHYVQIFAKNRPQN